MSESTDKHFDRTYFYPASLIIRRVGGNPAYFRQFWFALVRLREQKKADILDAYFGYNMKTGHPL